MGDCAINISYEDSVDKEGNVTLSAAQKLAEVAVETAKPPRCSALTQGCHAELLHQRFRQGGTVKLSHDATAIAKEMAPIC